MDFSSKPKVCFILGIGQRSGTNFIYRLLREHPRCEGPGPIWEDRVLRHSRLLSYYVDILYKSWKPSWEIEKKIGGKDILERYFGNAIEDFLRLQLTEDSSNNAANTYNMINHDSSKILLTKTPSVEGLSDFFNFFPNAYLILLVRDGRAVVESGVRSFNWNYERAIRRWRASAEAILDFEEKYKSTNCKFILIKYEDLVMDVKNELYKIFNFLQIDAEEFDFDNARNLGITGSSELRGQAGGLHWHLKEKTADFSPLARFRNWDRKKHERFNWIAGQQMTGLGYELDVFSGNKQLYFIWNMLNDYKESIRTTGVKVVRKILNVFKKINSGRSH